MIKCKKCGKENEDNNWKCIVCEDLLHEEVQKKVIRPSNFIMLSVIIILSGIPTGIISLVYGILVNSSFNKDEYDKAKKYSKNYSKSLSSFFIPSFSSPLASKYFWASSKNLS